MSRTRGEALLLGEWACLGLVVAAPAHGFALSKRLAVTGDVGRVWSLSRALTYRALDQLVQRGLVVDVGEEPGVAGGSRTIYAATDEGASLLREWLDTPVLHLRDVRSDLLLKIVIAGECQVDVTGLLRRQLVIAQSMADGLRTKADDDLVAAWRAENADAVVRFLERALR